MNNRKRNVQIKFRVTEEERGLIEEKMKQVPTRNMEAYLRKMAIDGYIIQVDHSDIKKMTAELQKIGVNINQIAKHNLNYIPIFAYRFIIGGICRYLCFFHVGIETLLTETEHFFVAYQHQLFAPGYGYGCTSVYQQKYKCENNGIVFHKSVFNRFTGNCR